MTKDEFQEGFQDLCSRWNKRPNEGLIDIYYKRLRRIPGLVFHDIVKGIIDNYKFFPRPQDIKNEYVQWLESHPEKKAPKNITPCAYCDTRGILEYTYHDHEMNRSYDGTCRCGHCDNWHKRFIPSHWPYWTVKQIEQSGHKLTGATAFNVEWMSKKPHERKPERSFNECKKMAVDEIPF